MSTLAAIHSGLCSDPGRQRKTNEDRVFADDARGIFLVVDGLGGHAAGEIAAETAVQTIANQMRAASLSRDPEFAIRQAITAANNRIFDLTETHPEWKGMACVLTLAIVRDDRVTVGHVGDSRLYLSWNGHLKKITCDHSPVGEQEDAGTLTEEEAMQHPRRNEVFRDVGSRPRTVDEPQFIEIKTLVFRPDAALLLCSDGLSDLITSVEISSILERYDGAPDQTAQQLVNAANRAGGKDNVSVVFVPGPEFIGSECASLAEARPRHAITRTRGEVTTWRGVLRNIAWLVAGMLLGGAVWRVIEHRTAQHSSALAATQRAPIIVNATDPHGIQKALAAAQPGDTVVVPAGDYLGPLELKNHINLVGQVPTGVNLRSDPYAAADGRLAVVARSIQSARLEGFRIIGDEAHPLRSGVWLASSSVELVNLDISGAIEAGIQIEGASQPVLLANFIHSNVGPGIMLTGGSPRLVGNWIVENGMLPHELRPGIEVGSEAHLQQSHNIIAQNGAADRFSEDPSGGKRK